LPEENGSETDSNSSGYKKQKAGEDAPAFIL
jgi:hypothetical protein